MHVFITGHTGFKGSWLTLLLTRLGHTVSGYSLHPVEGSLFELARIESDVSNHFIGDIRDKENLSLALLTSQPDAVIHLAAQPLVRDGYRQPRETFEVNVMGTLNVLEASMSINSIKSILNITTDKVYKENPNVLPYAEDASLGGKDPYSASKSMADILSSSLASSFRGNKIVNARAGNVIGGGDNSRERLIPDLVSSFKSNNPAIIRAPESVRPWQHVLDCLSGYELLLEKLSNDEIKTGTSWNFGPNDDSMKSVGEITELATDLWGPENSWEIQIDDGDFHEAKLLTLDSQKSRSELNWVDHLPYPSSLIWTIDWYKNVNDGLDPRSVTLEQIDRFIDLK